jgi:hypothetical protein
MNIVRAILRKSREPLVAGKLLIFLLLAGLALLLALLQRLAEKFETSYDTCFSVRFSDYAASNSSMSDFQNSP